jgi:hypothetical protein
MDLFVSLALLLALAILFSALQRERITDASAYRKAVAFFIAAVIVHNPLMEALIMIPHLAFGLFATAARVVSWVLLLISFYSLCRSWGGPLTGPDEQSPQLPKQ